jgi:hypothetical protein
MPHMRIWLCCLAALASGCLVPRSMVYGMTAAPVGRGATEVGVFTGVHYAAQYNPPTETRDIDDNPVRNQTMAAGFGLPAFEANIQHGFTDHLGLNVHLSPAGVQPGLKWTLNKSKVAHVALLPALAFGYGSGYSEVQFSAVDGILRKRDPRQTTSFTFLTGLKVIASHRSGVYGGVGYDFIFNRSLERAIVGTGNTQDEISTLTESGTHQISAAIGFDITLGLVHLKPEVAFAISPLIANTVTNRAPASQQSASSTGGWSWAIFPGFTLSVASPPRARTAEEIEEEEEAERKARRKAGDDEDDDDEDERPRQKGKKQRQLDDDEEEDNPKKRRRAFNPDDD